MEKINNSVTTINNAENTEDMMLGYKGLLECTRLNFIKGTLNLSDPKYKSLEKNAMIQLKQFENNMRKNYENID